MKRFLFVAILAMSSLLFWGCVSLDAIIQALTDLAYGERKPQSGDNRNPNGCATLKCSYATDCRFIQQEGSFEVIGIPTHEPYWFGDPGERLVRSIDPTSLACDGIAVRRFNDLTGDNSFRGRAAQQVHVMDLRDHLTPAELQNITGLRVRALGNFSGNDVRAGIHLVAYRGDPAAFLNQNRTSLSQQADPETFPVQTADYALLDSAGTVLTIFDPEDDGGETWTPIATQMQLPPGTTFITAIIEAYKSTNVFTSVLVDNVQAAVDRGNSGPQVAGDVATTRINTPVSIFPLSNDFDYDGFIDPATFRFRTPPLHGSITFGPSPTGAVEVIYTPEADYTGADAFSYEVSDDEGLIFSEAPVSIFIPPDDALAITLSPDAFRITDRSPWYTSTISVIRSPLLIGEVTLAVQPHIPRGITTYIDPVQLDPDNNQSTLYFKVDASVSAGAYPIVVRGSTIGFVARDTLLLLVQPVSGLWVGYRPTFGSRFTDVAFADANNGVVVGWAGYIYRTTDGGDTWVQQQSGVSYELEGVAAVGANTYFACGRSTILRSTDGGVTWNPVAGDFTLSILNEISFYNNAVGTAVGNGEVYWTTDGGTTWENRSREVTDILYGVAHWDAQNALAVGNTSLGAGNAIVLRTTDAGMTWELTNATAEDTEWFTSVSCPAPGVAVVVGSMGTILKTIDGGDTWQSKPSGTSLSLQGVSFVSEFIGAAVGGDIGTNVFLRTTNGGEIWFEESDDGNTPSGFVYGVEMVTPELGFAVGQNRRIFRRQVQ